MEVYKAPDATAWSLQALFLALQARHDIYQSSKSRVLHIFESSVPFRALNNKMVVQVLRASSFMPAARRPQVVRASVIPNGLSRRHRYRGNPCGPSLMALSPLDAFFDLSPSQLLETEEFMGLERARPMAVDFVEVRS